MTRILEAGLEAAVARRGTEPGWLILIDGPMGTLRYSTRGTLTYDGSTWTGGAVLRGVEFSGDLGASVTLELPNTDNSASALALSDLLRDSEVTLYAYHGDSAYETELLSDNSAFDAASWTKGNVTISANTVATTDPDGGNAADIVQETTTPGAVYHVLSQQGVSFEANELYAFAASLKAGTRDYVKLVFRTKAASYPSATFNLAAGTAVPGSSPALLDYSIIDQGAGWYRCEIVADSQAGATVALPYVETLNAAGTTSLYASTAQDNFYIYNATLRRGTALAYATALRTLVIDAVESIGSTRVELSLSSVAEGASRLPDVLVGPPLCNHIPPAGTVIKWGSTSITLERE